MSHRLAKEQRRNLKNVLGDTAAAAVADVRMLADQAGNEARILAKQMLTFELQLSGMREARAIDKQAIADLKEQLQNVSTRLEQERTHRIQLAREQRDYVDGEDARLARRIAQLETPWWLRLLERVRGRR